ncbi:hypothetical protein SLEP1_g29907 [Rubroshorea leprosula]|uniref:RNase H type-1 domain-containing protein n=1 Tax=Rubroshorea leprosula TaxID=152421 RepID=A0AAV5K6J8_9ROSI|nr:hypothetical protein SLEP1_g29907 [Rubroshorea leprosula]
MGCFKLPQNFLQSLNSIISNFWWGDNTDRRRIHWLRWDLVCKPKRFGGLGFRDFRAFNLAMLAKQSWRLMQDRTTLCYQILRAKYFPNGDLLGASVGANVSMVWRGVVDGLGILKLGSTWRIGTGQDVRLCRDNWLPSGAILRPRSALIQQDMDDRHVLWRIIWEILPSRNILQSRGLKIEHECGITVSISILVIHLHEAFGPLNAILLSIGQQQYRLKIIYRKFYLNQFGTASLGVVLRDSNGGVLGAGKKTISFQGTVNHAEVLAINFGISIPPQSGTASLGVVLRDSNGGVLGAGPSNVPINFCKGRCCGLIKFNRKSTKVVDDVQILRLNIQDLSWEKKKMASLNWRTCFWWTNRYIWEFDMENGSIDHLLGRMLQQSLV